MYMQYIKRKKVFITSITYVYRRKKVMYKHVCNV